MPTEISRRNRATSLEMGSHHHKYPIVQQMNVAFVSSSRWHGAIERGSKRIRALDNGRGPSATFRISQMRFQTKFTQEPKERMLEFVEKVEWRIQKQDEECSGDGNDRSAADIGGFKPVSS
ncbi:hypothetical protein L484_001995 [Morus notabilis]|uniref:Uncharacterized protein n=1 Tax=Morus notabilis TaxID=981085 RepID=W9QT79_9ROSA|nr:hypothetical protein L484_001995 [Morus notabilis]